MNKIPFGLDIGASTIKVVWLEGKADAFVLKAAAMVPTPPKGMLSESPLDEEEMSRAVQKAVTSANIDSKQVNVALAENQVYTKASVLPSSQTTFIVEAPISKPKGILFMVKQM